MKYNQLGRTGLLVSDLCLGTMIFGDDASGTLPDEARRLIHTYLDAGGNHVDTANVYTGGRSEEIVGEAIRDRRDRVVLATKVRVPQGAGVNQEGLSRHHILHAVEESLRRLGTDYIDLYYMHVWDVLTPIDESLRAMDDLVRSGKVRYVGISNFKAWQLMKALSVSDALGLHRPVAAQYQYSLVKRDIEYEFSDLCQSEGVGLIPWGPLGGGFLTGKYRRGERPTDPDSGRIARASDDLEEAWQRRNTERNWRIIDAVGEIADARGATYPQIALAWLRSQPMVDSVILGARTAAQLEDNLGAAEIELTPEELLQLNQVSALPEMYPYHMYDQYAPRMNL